VAAVVMGWGVGVAPEIQVRTAVEAGQLVMLRAEISVDVALYWHQWQLQARGALLDQIGQALADGARRALG
jgi:LysR family transcriptional regulator (chromosome initiation inhibitor)